MLYVKSELFLEAWRLDFMDLKDIKSMSLAELENDFKELLVPSYRASQVCLWLKRGATTFDEMSNLPKGFRDILKSRYYITNLKIKSIKKSIDGTVKYLFELPDGEFIESVIMNYKHGYSVCLSTQVGCKMGCSFCETGKCGFSRNLTPSEILAQIETAQKDLSIRISNVVLMGMGEPLDNYDNVIKFLKLVTSENGLNIGMRHISLSTCGLVDKIYSLANEKMPITLSVSLHAPNDEIRSRIMKINKKWNLEKLIKACKEYILHTGRRISFEYAMIENLNDTSECAADLAELLKGMLCHVNLIPLNGKHKDEYLKKSSNNRIYKFKQILEDMGITTTIRRTLGEDIDASCGQLKNNYLKNEVV